MSAAPTPAPASTAEALAMLSRDEFLAAAEPAAMPAACLQVLEQADEIGIAARTSILAGSTASQRRELCAT